MENSAREIAQWLRPLAAVAENPSLVLNIHCGLTVDCNSGPGDLMPSADLHRYQVLR